MLRVYIVSHLPVPEDVIDHVGEVLSRVSGVDVYSLLMEELVDFALQFYDSVRGQVNAELLLSFLKSITRVSSYTLEKYVYVIDVDAFVPGLDFVFGVAELCGDVAVVFTLRLRQEFWNGFYRIEVDPRRLFRERLKKEILHELGHTLCLEHCPNRRCVMSFSNSIIDVDYKSADFCVECLGKLRRIVSWRRKL